MSYENSPEYYRSTLGAYGFQVVETATVVAAGDTFCAIEAVEESAITANCVSNELHANADTTVGETLAAGSFIYGIFDTLNVTSGKVRAYYAEPTI